MSKIDEFTTLAHYMGEVSKYPQISVETERICSQNIARIKSDILIDFIESPRCVNYLYTIYQEINSGTRTTRYTNLKEESEEENRRSKKKTLSIFECFFDLSGVNKNVNTMHDCLKRLNLDLDLLREISINTNVGLDKIKEINENQKILVEGNLKLVISIAKLFLNCGVSLEDLVQEGNLGLLRATEDYDYLSGNKFCTYAYYWIRQKISRIFINKMRTIRFPANVVLIINDISNVIKESILDNGLMPSKEEIAQKVGVTPDKLSHLLMMCEYPLSLDSTIVNQKNDDNFAVKDMVPDEDAMNNMERFCEVSEFRTKINEILPEILNPKEEKILRLRFGLYPEFPEEMTFKQIATISGLTKQRIDQICSKAVLRIRKRLQKNLSPLILGKRVSKRSLKKK